MKYTIIIFIGFLFLCCNSPKNKNVKQKQEINEQELSIANQQLDSLRIKVCDFFNESSEGGEIKGYYNNDYLSKIEVELYGELGKVFKEFINNTESDFFEFKQKYYYYDKPFYEQGFKVIDSVIIEGTYNNEIINKKVTGERLKEEELNKILLDVGISKSKYSSFLKGCKKEN